MLAISLEYLLGRAYATAHTDYRLPEWPPHPARIFYALVAAYHETCGPEDPMSPSMERQALLWLEALAPPTVYASEASIRGSTDPREPTHPTTHFVVVNDARGDTEEALPDRRGRQARLFPSVTPHVPQVILLYPDAFAAVESTRAVEPTQASELRQALGELLSRVTYVGHSASLVSMRVLEPDAVDAHLAGLSPWIPDPQEGETLLRIPAPGLLDALETTYARTWAPDSPVEGVSTKSESDKSSTGTGRKKSPEARKTVQERKTPPPSYAPRGTLPAQVWAYRPPWQQVPEAAVSRGVFRELVIFRRVEGPRLPLEAFPACSRILRAACMALAETPSQPLSGHSATGEPTQLPHVAFLPLPDIGHDHARGHLLGIAAALPASLEVGARRHVLAALAGIEHLTLGRAGVWEVERLVGEPEQYGLRANTWTRPSKHWATATPLVLDRFPKDGDRFGAQAEAIVTKACLHAGFPAPLSVVLSPTALLAGVPPARAFPPLERKGRGPLLHVHAVLTFDEPVAGPMLIGAGRYLGYGLCRPSGGR